MTTADRCHRLSTGEFYYSGLGVGEMWDEIGRLQFDYLVQQGLLPTHSLLDIGCGSLRGGVHFIDYLEKGGYAGVDRSAFLITAALEVEIPCHNLEAKAPRLFIRDDFHFLAAGTEFDFLIAQSVFTHLPWNSILRCLRGASKVMGPASRLYATFFENAGGDPAAVQLSCPSGGFTYLDKDPYHYDIEAMRDLGRRAGLKASPIGEWGHPRGQKMLLYMRI
jgi:SAM-dependent methyltransferase